jgi:MOSC domain-containing protein YiiM
MPVGGRLRRTLTMTGTRFFLGGIRPLPPDNRPSAIVKCESHQPLWLGLEGLGGDAQADRRVHGGPEKALHQYAVANYAKFATAFPEAAPLLMPGSIGENLSVPGWDETTVCIGDVFRLGDARIQVSQPRSPCWKIDARYGQEGMAQFIDETGITGWYFRVQEEGQVEAGCAFELTERPNPEISLARLWRGLREHRPALAELDILIAAQGLTPGWSKKLTERREWLRNNA